MPAPQPGWDRSTLRALFADAAAAEQAATLLLAQDWAAGSARAGHRGRGRAGLGAPDAVAVRAGGDHAELLDRAELARTAGRAARVIRLDPGLAFGTGTHPTTRMCLRWIAGHAAQDAQPWPRVLDYGCGSGILAIAAALHGAAGHRRGRHRPRGRGVHPGQCHGQRRAAARRPARRCAGPVPAGAGQHPGHAAEAAGAAAVRPSSRRAAPWCWPASWSARPTN